MHSGRLAVISAVAISCVLGSWGAAQAASYSENRSCIPQNDHSSTDLSMHPDCPGNRDIRDDAENHGGRAGPEDRGPFGDLLKF
jgi:hypothetical protein